MTDTTPKDFAARLSAVIARFGGKAMPPRMQLDHGNFWQMESGRWKRLDETLAAHAWAGWLVERLGLYTHGGIGRVRMVSDGPFGLGHYGEGPTLADACLSLLEQWQGASPFTKEKP